MVVLTESLLLHCRRELCIGPPPHWRCARCERDKGPEEEEDHQGYQSAKGHRRDAAIGMHLPRLYGWDIPSAGSSPCQ